MLKKLKRMCFMEFNKKLVTSREWGLLLACMCLVNFVWSQDVQWGIDGSVTVDHVGQSFQSSSLQYLDLERIFTFQMGEWGSFGDIGTDGSIKVEVFVYDPEFPNGDSEGYRPLLCSITQRTTSNQYIHQATQIFYKHEEESKSYFTHYFRLIFGSNSGYSDTNYPSILKDWESNDIKVGAIRASLLDEYEGVISNKFVPVIIKATLVNATFKKLRLPGKIDEMIPAKIFRENNKMDLNIASFVGNLGFQEEALDKISKLLDKVNSEVILSTGNWNNYRPSEENNFDEFVGPYFYEYLNPYIGIHGEGSSDINRFYSACGEYAYKDSEGNSFDDLEGESNWKTFFSKNNQEVQYYDFKWGQVHFFVLNTNNRYGESQEPIADENSIMAQWLKANLEDSADTSKFKIVLMHHPPYASNIGNDNGFSVLRWPYKEWGAHLVISGYAGFYERHEVDGLTYIVNGLSGAGKSIINDVDFAPTLVTESHYDNDYGVLNMFGTGWPERNSYNFQFRNTKDEMKDQFWLFSDQTTWSHNRDLQKIKQNSDEVIDLFLLLGQSNMRSICEEANTAQGRCLFDLDDPDHLTNTYLFNDHNVLELASNPINQYATCDRKPPTYGAVNVGWTFGPKVYANTGVKVGLISNSVGDTFIRQWQKNYDIRADNDGKEYEEWQKTWMHIEYKGENPYGEAINRVKKALDLYPNAKLRAILWIQGENDAASGTPPKHATATSDELYTAYLNQMVSDFRVDLKDYTGNDDYMSLPFLIGEIRHDEDLSNPHPWSFNHYNELFEQIAVADPYKFIVSSKGFTILKWGVHFDLSSNKIYGERFADVYLNSIGFFSDHNKTVIKNKDNLNEIANFKNQFILYSNPSRDNFTISILGKDNFPFKIEIVNTLGEIIYSKDIKVEKNDMIANKMIVKLNGVKTPGVYLVKIHTSRGMLSKKIINY